MHTDPQSEPPSSILKIRGDMMQHVDNQRFEDVLFRDVNIDNNRFNNAHKYNTTKCFAGNIRLNLGLYRTPVETERYIRESLKQKLP